MRRKAFAGCVAGLALGSLVFGTSVAYAEPYAWQNVQIVGGGYVPGIIFNETEPGLVYARTDIGGAYRQDPVTKEWIPLLDWVGPDNWGYTGVASLATDPKEPDLLYLAVGGYTNSWDPNPGAILRSLDRGATWEAPVVLPFKLGGNMPGRSMGERLAIDPNDNSILFLAAPNEQPETASGLWKSTDYGATWDDVGNFPAQ
jgi:xyloglucan-specific exo-beta-1,4-glucanase